MSSALAAYRCRLKVLSIAYEANQPTLIWGLPGEGKTSLISAFAQEREIHEEVVVTSLREPTDLNGLPVVGPDGVVRLAPPAWLVATNAHQGSLIVFDELTTAPPSTRAATLRVISERVSADTALNDTSRIVAIANPPEYAEDGWELGAPLANRLLHIRDWELPIEVFTRGIATGEWMKVPVFTVDADAIADELGEVSAAMSGFLHGAPQMRSQIPEHPSERQYPWPSPRSWEMCVRLLAFARAALNDDPDRDDVLQLLAEGTIGSTTAPVFMAFLSAIDFPSPEEMLAKPTGWNTPERGDLMWAVLSRALQYVQAQPDGGSAEQWTALGQVIAYAAEAQGDVAVAVALQWWDLARRHGPSVIPAELAGGRFANVLTLASV